MPDPKSKASSEKIAERSSIIEEQIRESQRRKEERQFLEELAKRISIAREGRMHAEKTNYTEALASYRRFLNITAKYVDCEVSDLKPSLFAEKDRHSEALLISSIVFDLMKILDKLETSTAKEERAMYHKLFIRFTVGQNYQNFAAENLRKFLTYRKSIRHKSEFWATYNAIKVKRFCLVATWAFESGNHPRVAQLRQFRDKTLSRFSLGRLFIKAYYRNGYHWLRFLRKIPHSKKAVRFCLETFCRLYPPRNQ